MPFIFDHRPSDSPLVESVWRTQSGDVDRFLSVATCNWEICVMQREGETAVTVRGPETAPSQAQCPEDAEFFGITFKVGTLMPHFSPASLVDSAVNLMVSGNAWFRLAGSNWDVPDFENADAFVSRLVREGLLVSDEVVDAALKGCPPSVSPRSVQRRFVQTTGLTHTAVRQIQRARHAAALLKSNVSIAETADQAGYADQAHMTRSLQRFIGRTPAQIVHQPVSLSLL